MANEEHLKLLRSSVKEWNKWRKKNKEVVKPDFTEAYLSGANLQRADLTGADLTGANLTGAIMNNVDLWRADLRGAILSGASLHGAKIKDASINDNQALSMHLAVELGVIIWKVGESENN